MDKIDTAYHYVPFLSVSGAVEYRRELKPQPKRTVSDKVSVRTGSHGAVRGSND